MLHKNDKGFSLIELIIVIAIMAVLVAVIAPNLTKYLSSSKENTDIKNMDTIKSTIEQACALTAVETAEPTVTDTWVELAEDSAYFDSDAANVGSYMAFGKYVASVLGEVPKSKMTGDNFEVKITGNSSTSYRVEVRVKE